MKSIKGKTKLIKSKERRKNIDEGYRGRREGRGRGRARARARGRGKGVRKEENERKN